jgi:hypothetical protein
LLVAGWLVFVAGCWLLGAGSIFLLFPLIAQIYADFNFANFAPSLCPLRLNSLF